jgi:hypothetical protein
LYLGGRPATNSYLGSVRRAWPTDGRRTPPGSLTDGFTIYRGGLLPDRFEGAVIYPNLRANAMRVSRLRPDDHVGEAALAQFAPAVPPFGDGDQARIPFTTLP